MSNSTNQTDKPKDKLSSQPAKEDLLFFADMSDQRQAVDTLVEESRADGDYYFYLIMSGFIACLGLLNNNPVVIIGAMLIAPALFPILSLGMALVTASREATLRAIKVITMSFIAVVASTVLISFLFHSMIDASPNQAIMLASSPNMSSILIALVSGLIASYAWVKQSQSALLPGVAVAVSLVPPLANIGIGITAGSMAVFSGSLLTFILNLIGICMASVAVFSVFGFSGMRNWQSLRLRQEKKVLAEEKEKITNTINQIEAQSTDKNQ